MILVYLQSKTKRKFWLLVKTEMRLFCRYTDSYILESQTVSSWDQCCALTNLMFPHFFLPLPITSMSKHHIRLASSKNNQIPNSCNILNLTKKLLLVIGNLRYALCQLSAHLTIIQLYCFLWQAQITFDRKSLKAISSD